MRRQDKGPRFTKPYSPEERAAWKSYYADKSRRGRVSRWAAVFVALVMVAGVSVAQNLISGGNANPQSGSARLDYLAVGMVDAGTVYVTNTSAGAVRTLGGICQDMPNGERFLQEAVANESVRWGPTNSSNSCAMSVELFRISGDTSQVQVTSGNAVAPGLALLADVNTGLYSVGADQLGVATAGARSFSFSATAGKLEGVNSNPWLILDTTSGACVGYTASSSLCATTNIVTVAASSGLNVSSANAPLQFGGLPVLASTTPTISSGFGTSPSVTAGKAYAFRVNVGTGGTANNGTIALGTTATNGWNCTCTDITTQTANVFLCKQTASSTTTATIGNFDAAGAAAAWAASDILAVTCTAF